MKTLTMTIDATPGTDVPDAPEGEPSYKDGVGFRITITTPSGASATPPIENKLTWVFSNMVEGGLYRIKTEVVDVDGRAIQTVEHEVTVPQKSTYSHINGVSFAFA